MNQGENWNKKMGGRSCFITSGAFGHGLQCGIGATIHIGREILCLPYAGFFLLYTHRPYSPRDLIWVITKYL